MFLEKFNALCEEKGIKIRAVGKELGIGSSTISNWLNGTLPKIEHIKLIAKYFNVSLDYLIGNEEISIRLGDKQILGGTKAIFKTPFSLPQRWISLRRGATVSNDDLNKIINYTNCPMSFLFSENTEFNPAKEYDRKQIYSTDVLIFIMDIMDKCADGEDFRILQLQLSRIVLYHLKETGITKETLANLKAIDSRKLGYIVSGKKNRDCTLNYGFNYSDLSTIAEEFNVNYQFMFTGISENPVDTLLKENAALRKKLDKKKN